MITITIDLLAKGVTLIVLFMLIASFAKAQTAAGDIFTTVTYLPTTFGWQAPYWVKYTDSASMLSPYLRKTDTASLSNRIDTKLNSSGFTKAAMVALGMMAYTDTSAMLSPYLRKVDTASLSNRINTKFNTPAGTTAQYVRGDGSLSTFPTSNLNVYDRSGLLATNAKLFSDTFTISSATPTISLSSYLSAMSASNFKLISATGYRASATTSNSPNVSVTGMTSNSVTLILNQVNTATVVILGINVLSGLPMILVPDPTNVKVVLSFYAW